jgi:hypothetical protein
MGKFFHISSSIDLAGSFPGTIIKSGRLDCSPGNFFPCYGCFHCQYQKIATIMPGLNMGERIKQDTLKHTAGDAGLFGVFELVV